jgi:hypothetical protein
MSNKKIISAILVIIIAAAAVYIYNYQQNASSETLEPVVQQPILREPAITEPPLDLISSNSLNEQVPATTIISAPMTLDNSDAAVLLAVADFSPTLTKWLLPNEQIRKWVLTIDLVASGKLPKRYRPVDYPMKKFEVSDKGADKIASEKNLNRMSNLIAALSNLDATLLASYYKQWLPLLETAYREQGKPGSFDQRFQLAMSQVIAVNPLNQQATLIRPSVLYQYETNKLEEANDVDKLLWRMGSDNSQELQTFVRELRFQLSQ